MEKPRNLIGRGLWQEKRQRGGCRYEAEHAGDLRERGSDEPGQSLSLLGPGSPAPGCAFPLSLRQQRCPIKKARATAGQGSVVFSYWPTLRSIGVTGVAVVRRPPFGHLILPASGHDRRFPTATAAPVPVFRKCASARRRPVELDADRLVLGQEGWQFGREVDFGGLGLVRIAGQRCGFVQLRIRASVVYGSAGIGHAGRQPGRRGLARRLVETEASVAFRGIESGFERRRDFRLLATGVVSCPAVAEDIPADREAVRLLDPAPVIGGGRPPVIGKRDREPPPSGLDDRIGPVLDRQLRLDANGDAAGEKALFGLGRQCCERREAFRRR